MAERLTRVERHVLDRAGSAALRAAAWASERRTSGTVLAVVTYHRVAPEDERPDLLPGLAVAPERFAEQVRMLVRRADPVSLDDIVAAADGGPALPRRAVHITFDDAYRCVEEHAWPILRTLQVPASLYVPSRYPDQDRSFWWDRLHHAVMTHPGPVLELDGHRWLLTDPAQRVRTRDQIKALVGTSTHQAGQALVTAVCAAAGVDRPAPATSSWAGLRRMAAEGLAIGSHTRHHPFLDQLDPDQLDAEVAGSLQDLRQQLGGAARPAIAYPGGHVDDAAVDAARRAGIRVGFTTTRGVTAGSTAPDWLRLPRINVGRRASTPIVRAQLGPEPHRVHDLVRTAPSTLRRPDGDRRQPPWRALWN